MSWSNIFEFTEKEEIPNGEVIQVKITGRENSIDILSTSSPDDPGDYQKIQDSTLEENQSDTNDHQFDKQIPVKKGLVCNSFQSSYFCFAQVIYFLINKTKLIVYS